MSKDRIKYERGRDERGEWATFWYRPVYLDSVIKVEYSGYLNQRYRCEFCYEPLRDMPDKIEVRLHTSDYMNVVCSNCAKMLGFMW